MRAIDEVAQIVRSTVEARRGVQVYAVITPPKRAGEVRNGHHLDYGNSEPSQFRQLFCRGTPCASRREGAHMQLIEHVPFRADPAPAAVRPSEAGWVDDFR